jgi:hypothetical protein
MKRALSAVFAVSFLALATNAADARPRHKIARADSQTVTQCVSDNNGRTVCGGSIQRTSGLARGYEGGTVIGGRPAGCPRQYCGCGAMRDLGLSDKRLWKAWNWTKFYHGPTPVAVWPHHIAIIERMTGPHTAILRDYNSGRGLSRIHERSIAGARIVGRVSYAANP